MTRVERSPQTDTARSAPPIGRIVRATRRDTIEFGIQRKGQHFSLIQAWRHRLKQIWEAIKTCFQWIKERFSPPPLPPLYHKVVREEDLKIYLPNDHEKEVSFGKNRTLFLGSNLTTEELKKILSSVFQEENIHEITTNSFKHAKQLWECGYTTVTLLTLDFKKHHSLLEVLVKAFAQPKESLDAEKKKALNQITFEVVTGILDPVTGARNLGEQKKMLNQLEKVFATKFDLQRIVNSLDPEQKYLRTNLEELTSCEESTTETEMSVSISVSALLPFIDPNNHRIMAIPQTSIFKTRR